LQQLKVALIFAFLIFFLFSWTYLSITYCEACTRGCLLTNCDVTKSITHEVELKQILRFSQELIGLEG